MRIRPSKKQITLLSLIGGFIVLLICFSMIYRFTSLREPGRSLLTLLPNAPICYLSIKNLGGFVQTFEHSDFGKQAVKMPILAEIQRERWWREVVHQKRLWEYETGGKLDLKTIKGYFGDEAILSLYHRGDEISFLLTSVVGAKEKLEIAAVAATDPVNPNYKRLKEHYRGIDINTITGYPRDFSYAFVGKIGLLTIDKSLIWDTIDIYEKGAPSFTDRHPAGKYLRQQYDATGSTIYADFSRFAQVFASGEQLKPLLAHVDIWTFSNRYENGVIYSRHRLVDNASGKPARPKSAITRNPRPIDPRLLSILPATTAFLGGSSNGHPTAVWQQKNTNPFLRHKGNQIALSRHLKSEFALALLAPPSQKSHMIPSILLILPIKDRAGLAAELMKLKDEQILIDGKPLQFLKPQDYHGTELHPAQLRFGFLFSLKGGYTIIDNYWIISSTIAGLQSSIDAFTEQEAALSERRFPASFHQAHESYVFIRPTHLIPQLEHLMPIVGLIGAASGQQIHPEAITRITNNLFPLEALEAITAGIDIDRGMVDAEIQIVLETEKH